MCGTPLESIGTPDFKGQFLIAVDIDQDDLVEPVRHALRIGAARVCAKKGRRASRSSRAATPSRRTHS